jgi:hypothetical protein
MMKLMAFAVAAALALPGTISGQERERARDEARPRDLQRLQEDLANLDEDLQVVEGDAPKADEFRSRADEIREEAIYLKVKMRRHQALSDEGTGVSYAEAAELRRSIADLREDIERSLAREARDVRLAEGTEFLVRLEESMSSRTARQEDRFEATVFRPVRADGTLALQAGTRLRGIVRQVERAQRPSRSGQLVLDFDAVWLDRDRLPLKAQVVSILENDPGPARKAGIGAILGGAVGSILGGRKGALAGVIIGGTGAVVATKGDDVELPAGTLLSVRLDRTLVLPRR